uniref:Putative wbp2like protein n=1 Tax=Corethrella appendiculata TaxID=1370023 RepID=U5EYZ4_9DIPT
MSLNTAHANNGVLIHAGECILIFSDHVTMEFSGQDNSVFKGSKVGRVYLTTHRMIFNNKNTNDALQSFSFPFISISDVELEQPVFGANYIKGKVRAQENGNWNGEVKFKILFKRGGAIEYGQAMLRAASMAQRNAGNSPPPPYIPPTGSWYAAPPPAYTTNPQAYGWIPQNDSFSNPAPNSVFIHDNPPPYPGITPAGYQAGGFASNGYNGYPQQGFGGYPGQGPPATGYPGQGPQAPPATGYPGFQPQPGNNYPVQPGNTYPTLPPQGAGYPSSSNNYPGAMGFTQPPQPNSKEAEAAQSAYYDPSRPQTAYVPPPAYYEPPPSYNSLGKKEQ